MEFTKEELANEEWRDVVGYEGLYQVSSLGRVRSCPRKLRADRGYFDYKGKILCVNINRHGYCKSTISDGNGKMHTYPTHRLVAMAFIPNQENKPCIDHINAIKTDNRVSNLRWVTYKENMQNPLTMERRKMRYTDEVRQKLREQFSGENNPFYGRTHTQETKDRISKTKMGVKMSDEFKAKLSVIFSGKNNPNYGKHHTPEAKAKIREAQRLKQMRKVVQLTLDWGFIAEYECLKDASRALGFKTSANIWSCCNGRADKCGGYKWMYKEDYEILLTNKK